MIEVLEGLRDNVAAFAFHGHVTKTDYDTVLIADFEDRLAGHKKVRIYGEIATDLSGFDPAAVWADSKFGFGHFLGLDRCTVVSDVE